MCFGNRFIAGARCGQAILNLALAQKRKDLVGALTQHFVAAESGDPLHGAIPGNDAAVAIKRKEAIDASVEQALQQRWGFVRQSVRSVDFFRELFCPGKQQ